MTDDNEIEDTDDVGKVLSDDTDDEFVLTLDRDEDLGKDNDDAE
jgi:hypothetical protein